MTGRLTETQQSILRLVDAEGSVTRERLRRRSTSTSLHGSHGGAQAVSALVRKGYLVEDPAGSYRRIRPDEAP